MTEIEILWLRTWRTCNQQCNPNLIEQIEANYSEGDAKDLTNRLINSIRGKDAKKFSRGIKKKKKDHKRKSGGKTMSTIHEYRKTVAHFNQINEA